MLVEGPTYSEPVEATLSKQLSGYNWKDMLPVPPMPPSSGVIIYASSGKCYNVEESYLTCSHWWCTIADLVGIQFAFGI